MNETSKEEVVTPTLISNLGESSLREGATKIYETRNIHKNGNNEVSTTYRLRAWIDKSYTIDSSKTYQYKFSVNINSQVGTLINHEQEININQTTGGTVSAPTKAIVGDNIALEVTPTIEACHEYALNNIEVTNSETGEVYATLDTNNQSFVMPNYSININPTWKVSKQYLFNKGNACVAWVYGASAGGTNEKDYINDKQLRAASNQTNSYGGYWFTSTVINVGNVSHIYYNVSSSSGIGNAQVYGLYSSKYPDSNYTNKILSSSKGIISVNVSAINGNYYIGFHTQHAGGYAYISQIWIE